MNFHNTFRTLMLALFTIFLLLPVFAIAGKSESPFISIDKTKTFISVNLMNTDISDVAKALSDKAGIKVFLDQTITQKITSKFQNLPIEAGIKRLLGPISSAFVFVKKETPSGKADYLLDTVKIFNSGNILSADFKVYEKKGTDTSPGNPVPASKLYWRIPDTPAALGREILRARKNLDLIRKRGEHQAHHANQKIADLNMKLSQNLSPDERTSMIRKLSQTNMELSRVKHLNQQIIMDEETNLRHLIEEGAKMESRKKFSERQRLSAQQRSLGK